MTETSSPPTFAEVERARIAFSRKMLAYKNAGNRYLDPAPKLSHEHIEGCQILFDRFAILDRLPRNGKVAEIGVDQGLFSQQILNRTKPLALHLFDIDVARINPENIQEGLDHKVCHVHAGDSAKMLSKFEDHYFDWLYIDGDHTYKGVKADIAVATKKVKSDGFLIFNDYTIWSPATMSHCGVARAVNELCLSEGWRMVYFCFQSLFYNDVALRKIGR